MPRLAGALAITALAITLDAAPARSDVVLDASVAPAELMNEIERLVRNEFYDRSGLSDFDVNESRYRGMAATGGQPSDAVSGWLSTLRVSHTGRYTPDRIDYYELADIFSRGIGRKLRTIFPPEGEVTYPGIGIVPRLIDGKTFVADVYDGSPAARAGIMTGDEILSADGEPFAEIASFADRVGQEVRLELRRTLDGPGISISVAVESLRPNEALANAIRASARVFDKDEHRIGYLRLWTFAGPGVEDLIMELLSSEPLNTADGLVLDMRGRWGGAPADAADIFIGRAPQVEMIDRTGDEAVVTARWRKPIVGIIDEGSRSGMEILAYGLQRAGVQLVGTRTAGAVLAGRAFLLRDNSLLLLAVLDVLVEGERLERVGVVPDIELPHDIRYSAGTDPQFDRAQGELSRLLSNRTEGG